MHWKNRTRGARPRPADLSSGADGRGVLSDLRRGTGRVTLRRAAPLSLRAESLVVGLAVWLVYLLLRPDALATLGTLYDDVRYLALGKAIASGAGYRSIQLVHEPVEAMLPPGLPVVLALAWLIGRDVGSASVLAAVFNTVVVGVAAGLLWWFSRRHLGNDRLTTSVFVIGPLLLQLVVHYWTGAMTEPWFLLGWIAALLVFQHVTSSADRARRLRLAAVLGLVLAATTFFRT